MTDSVLSSVEDGVGVITLNRPEKLNAMHAPMLEALLEAAADMRHSKAVRCVVLTGAGRGFCSGGDLSNKVAEIEAEALLHPSLRSRPQTLTAHIDWLARIQQVSAHLHDMPKPTIAMINGPCAGAGFSLAGACDLRVAGASAMLTSAYSKAGVSGDFGGAYFWSHIVGAGKTRELYLLSEKYDAERALEAGLVSRIYPDEQLRTETLALAKTLADGATHVFGLMKQNIDLAEHAGLQDTLRAEAVAQVMCRYEARERRQLAEDAARISPP